MRIATRPKAVVLGLTSKMPFAGIVFLTMQYLVGLQRLGYDVYYVEEHGKMPWMLMRGEHQDGAAVAARFIADLMRRFDLPSDQWAYRHPHDQRQRHGLSEDALNRLFRDAAVIFNLHGGTVPRPEHYESGRLVYVGTDPVEAEVSLANGDRAIVDYLEPHCAIFTWGGNHGNVDCGVPVSSRFSFIPTRQPIVPDLWEPGALASDAPFSTIANWRQERSLAYQGETYQWSKHLEFLKFIELPQRSAQPFELALVNIESDEHELLAAYGWRVRDAASVSFDLDAYRHYIGGSRGEFTVAKDQNVRLRSGWFSDRSASYLACGRPVITQETGFSNLLPTGEGLFAFSTLEEIEDAVTQVNSDYPRHSNAARAIARDHFDYRLVLGAMLDRLDVKPLSMAVRV
jgi:hypothetical protein